MTAWQDWYLSTHLHNHKDDAVHVKTCVICQHHLAKLAQQAKEMHDRLTMCPQNRRESK
jgi:hypothetical protein